MIKVVDDLPKTNFYDNCITRCGKKMYYCPSFQQNEEMVQDFVIQNVKDIDICSDFIWYIPRWISSCLALEKIRVKGSRWFNIELSQLPKNVQSVEFVNQTNLNIECLKGMECCEKLVHLFLDLTEISLVPIENSDATHHPYFKILDEQEIKYPLRKTASLTTIQLECRYDFFTDTEISGDWFWENEQDCDFVNYKNALLQHSLFREIRDHVQSIEFVAANTNSSTWIIVSF